MNKLFQGMLTGTVLATYVIAVSAASNPIGESYVQLSSADWEAVCTSGTTLGGCFGNVGSVAYKKLERLLGYPAAAISLSLQSVPASVYIKQYGPNYAQANTGVATINALQVAAYTVCAAYTASGTPVGSYGILVPGTQNPNIFTQYSRNTLGVQPATTSTNLVLAQSSDNQFKNPITTEYVVCLGQSATTETSTPQALTNLVLT